MKKEKEKRHGKKEKEKKGRRKEDCSDKKVLKH